MTDRPILQASSRRSASTVAAVLLFMLPMLVTSIRAAAQASVSSDADEITFINGDRLTGKVLKESAGVVVFQSDVTSDVKGAAPITVPWSKIKELHTSKKFAVIRKDQKLKVGKPAPQVPVGIVTYSNDQISIGETKNIPAKDAAYLVDDSEFEKAIGHEPSFRHGWIGSGTVGASLLESTQTARHSRAHSGLHVLVLV